MNTPSLFSRLLLAFLLVATVSIANSSASTSDYLALGDDRIYYEDIGQGFPLVLVSGGSGMDLRQWDR